MLFVYLGFCFTAMMMSLFQPFLGGHLTPNVNSVSLVYPPLGVLRLSKYSSIVYNWLSYNYLDSIYVRSGTYQIVIYDTIFTYHT